MARLSLEHNELINMCTFDNRHITVKCNKFVDGQPCIDLLPRIRYHLRVAPTLSVQQYHLSAQLFFNTGLLVLPNLQNMQGFVQSVVLLNMSEKAVRLVTGREIFSENSSLSADYMTIFDPRVNESRITSATNSPTLSARADDELSEDIIQNNVLDAIKFELSVE